MSSVVIQREHDISLAGGWDSCLPYIVNLFLLSTVQWTDQLFFQLFHALIKAPECPAHTSPAFTITTVCLMVVSSCTCVELTTDIHTCKEDSPSEHHQLMCLLPNTSYSLYCSQLLTLVHHTLHLYCLHWVHLRCLPLFVILLLFILSQYTVMPVVFTTLVDNHQSKTTAQLADDAKWQLSYRHELIRVSGSASLMPFLTASSGAEFLCSSTDIGHVCSRRWINSQHYLHITAQHNTFTCNTETSNAPLKLRKYGPCVLVSQA